MTFKDLEDKIKGDSSEVAKHWKSVAVLLVLVLVLLYIMAFVWKRQQEPVTSQYTPAAPVKEVEKLKTVYIKVPQIKVVDKTDKAASKVLPESVIKDEHKHVPATGVIPPYEGYTNAYAVLDDQSGEERIDYKREPIPFLGTDKNFRFGLEAGYMASSQGAGPGGGVFVETPGLRFGPIHINGSVGGDYSPVAGYFGKAVLRVTY